MRCRRCSGSLGPGDAAHIVSTRPSGYFVSTDMPMCQLVGDCCLRPDERGFDGPRTGPPPTHNELSRAQRLGLYDVAMGLVFRKPRVVWRRGDGKPDSKCTKIMYELLAKRLIEWNVLPKSQQVPGGVNAWAKLTADGVEVLDDWKAFVDA